MRNLITPITAHLDGNHKDKEADAPTIQRRMQIVTDEANLLALMLYMTDVAETTKVRELRMRAALLQTALASLDAAMTLTLDAITDLRETF